jgi:UDP-glucuronate 4-epimerase
VTETIAVTGAVGFIGSHVSQRLLEQGDAVVGLDNFDPFYDRSIKEEALAALSGHPRFRFLEGDIRDPERVRRLLEGADAVIHLAARAGVRPSLEDPVLYSSVNVVGTTMLLETCRAAGVRRIVFGSSSSVYGDDSEPPFREDAAAVRPISPYAATKRAGELLCEAFAHLYALRIAVLRFFTVYGPRQRPDLAIHKFTRLLSHGRSIPQFGDGSAERDHTHIADIVQGVTGALAWTAGTGAACRTYNLGESRTVRLDRLIELIATALGVAPVIERLPPQPGDVRRTFADIGRARAELGYAPTVRMEDGIPDFIAWYRGWCGR